MSARLSVQMVWESTDTKERKKLSSFLGGSSSLGVIGEAYPLRSVF